MSSKQPSLHWVVLILSISLLFLSSNLSRITVTPSDAVPASVLPMQSTAPEQAPEAGAAASLSTWVAPNLRALDEMRSHKKEQEVRLHLEEVQRESISETVSVLKVHRFSSNFSPKVALPLQAPSFSIISRNRDILQDPRVAKLMKAANSALNYERDELMASIKSEIAEHGLGTNWRRSRGDQVPVDTRLNVAMPLLIAELDEQGELLPELCHLARLYVEEEYIFGGDPLLAGTGVSTTFTGTLGVAMEKVVANLAREQKSTVSSPTLADYTSRANELEVIFLQSIDEQARQLINFEKQDQELNRGFIELAEFADMAGGGLAGQFLDYTPEWFVPGNFDWLAIAAGVKINDELSEGRKK